MAYDKFIEYAGVEITTIKTRDGGYRSYCDRYQSVYCDATLAIDAIAGIKVLLKIKLRETLETTMGKKGDAE